MQLATSHSSSALRNMLCILLAFATLTPLAAAHSWVEEYQVISDNGSFTGPRGYSRGYVSRTDPTYNGFSLMWMLPSLEARNTDGTVRSRIDNTDLVCHPAQRTSNYTAAFPKLKVSPGDYVAVKYLENGHVSLPWNITGKPPGGGPVFIFGTTKPSDDEKIEDVMQWTRDGKGGNGNGWLVTAQNFDDGRCHQINCGSISQERQILQANHVPGQPTSTVESWCENDLLIPETITPGTLTTYWIWQFGTEANMDCNTPAGKDEYYTTCADFDVVDKSEKIKVAAPAAAADSSVPEAASNPQSVAVSDYKSRTAYTTAPSYDGMSNNKIPGPVSVDSAFVSSCSAQASIISAHSLDLWPEVYVPNSCGVISSFGTAAASAWSQTWDQAAASYTSGAENAWNEAFKAADMAAPKRKPWNRIPLTATATATGAVAGPSAEPTGTADTSGSVMSGYGEADSTPTTPGTVFSYSPSTPAASTAPTAAGGLTTIVTVVTLTSTLPVSQIASTSSSSSDAPSSSSAPNLAPTYSTSSSSASASASAPASSLLPGSASSTASSSHISIRTISTISGTGPPSTSDPAISTPTTVVAANGTWNYRRDTRAHARNWAL